MFEPSTQVTTGVDSLIRLLREKKMMSLSDAAKALSVNESLLQNWVDFLVEEGIVAMEYKFITPYVVLARDVPPRETGFSTQSPTKSSSQPAYQTTPQTPPAHDGIETKVDFFAKAKSRGIDEARTKALWRQYILNHKDSIKESFYAKATLRGMQRQAIDAVWLKYEKSLSLE